jgi:hypothetical protein
MTNTINPSISALKQRERRLKAKEQKEQEADLIERQQIAEANRIKKIKHQQKEDGTDIFSDSWGREVETDLVKQYEPNKDEYGFNVWGSNSSTQPDVNPLTKISHQENLKKIFGNRCESE